MQGTTGTVVVKTTAVRMVLGVIHFSNFSIEYGPLFPLHRIAVKGYVTIVDRLLKSLF